MKRISKKQLNNFIKANFDKGPSTILEDDGEIYYAKTDGSYGTRVGMEDDLKFLINRGVTEKLQSAYTPKSTMSLGYNPEEKKWYGWSHRAIFGFTVGSECKPGLIHFKPSNKEEFQQSCLSFWGDSDMDGDTYKVNPSVREFTRDGKLGALVEYTYNDEVPNERLRGTKDDHFSAYPKKWGKGEWTAKSMNDAKEMAIDFANAVS